MFDPAIVQSFFDNLLGAVSYWLFASNGPERHGAKNGHQLH
jgi:hypothetical protein